MKIISLLILSFMFLQTTTHSSDLTKRPPCSDHVLPGDQFAGGAGSVSNPFGICDITQLQQMELFPSSHFELWTDLDASLIENFHPLFNAEKAFTGSLNGLGHSINNLSINAPQITNVALISVCNECEIKNLNLNDVKIIGGDFTGALIGRYIVASSSIEANKTARISQVFVNGSVTGAYSTGGIFGNVYHVSDLLTEKTFLDQGLRFEGNVFSTFLSAQGLWMCGTFDYD